MVMKENDGTAARPSADSAAAAAERFFMPAEWAPHRRCWMAWPCREDFWGERLEEARETHARAARAIARFEPMRMIARPADAADARRRLGTAAEVWELPLDDSWLRDSGPTFVRDGAGRPALVDWRFNAWGEKHRPFADDDRLAGRLAERLGLRRARAPLVMEGGAFHADGEGTLLTTEQCLLHPNRNPGLSRGEIERELRRLLGAEKVIWLAGDPLDGETDGHVDGVACFLGPGRVMAEMSDDPNSPDYAALAENAARLRAATDARGRRLEVVEMPRPSFAEGWGGAYVNFYLANNNGAVMPAYGRPEADARALAVLRRALPGREVAQVEAAALAWGGGGVHCITQQEPLF